MLLPGPLICHGPLYRLLMLLPGPECAHGSLYGLPLLLSPSPHSAMCHFQVSSPLLVGFHFVIGCWQITGLHCCCQARNLPWAPRTDSSCCCQARNLSWAPVPPPHAAARSGSVSWVPVRPPIAAV
ncbi:unnamed protein product, partial [Staurois parvus]